MDTEFFFTVYLFSCIWGTDRVIVAGRAVAMGRAVVMGRCLASPNPKCSLQRILPAGSELTGLIRVRGRGRASARVRVRAWS